MTHEEIYEKFGSRKKVTARNMFGSKGLFINGNCFMALMKEAILLRLDEKGQNMAMKLKGSKYFDPRNTGKGMKNWITIPFDAVDKKCEAIVEEAFRYVSALEPKK